MEGPCTWTELEAVAWLYDKFSSRKANQASLRVIVFSLIPNIKCSKATVKIADLNDELELILKLLS